LIDVDSVVVLWTEKTQQENGLTREDFYAHMFTANKHIAIMCQRHENVVVAYEERHTPAVNIKLRMHVGVS
jgi:hypothetical protein